MVLTACVKVNGTSRYSTEYTPKPNNYPIAVFEENNINRAYKVIGAVSAPVESDQIAGEAINRLKIKARNLGGDALLGLRKERVSGSVELAIGGVRYRSQKLFWSAKVIVWNWAKTNRIFSQLRSWSMILINSLCKSSQSPAPSGMGGQTQTASASQWLPKFAVRPFASDKFVLFFCSAYLPMLFTCIRRKDMLQPFIPIIENVIQSRCYYQALYPMSE